MLIDRTVSGILEAFSSADPTPGGGSASALAGAIGASLLAMVAGMPKSKTNAISEREALDEAQTELLKLRDALAELVDRDASAYDLVVAAFRKPKATEEDKAERKAAIQDATRVATEVPLETMNACAQALKQGQAVAEFGNPSAKSDVAVAAQLLSSGMSGAMFNVEINLGSLADKTLVDALAKEMAGIVTDAGTYMRTIYEKGEIVELMKGAMERAGFKGHHPGAPPQG